MSWFRIGSVCIVFLAAISVLLFPIIAQKQMTFSQWDMHPEETMEKYQFDWEDTTLKRAEHPHIKTHVSGEQVASITIPKMEIYELPVYYGADEVNNNWQITTPGHLGNWSVFGEAGVSCVGAHNYQLFKNLNVLVPGDKILIETTHDVYVYVVDEIDIYHAGQDDWNQKATKHKAPYALNLMTCYPFDAVETDDMYIVYTSIQKGTLYASK